jgi:hypothetical protein
MLLHEITSAPSDSLDYAERLINKGSPSGFTEQNMPSQCTNPFFSERFLISVITESQDYVKDFGELPDLLRQNDMKFPFFVHPDLKSFFPELNVINSNLHVIPTSSARTVKIDGLPFYLKLCYPNRIGRVTRELDDRHIQTSIETTRKFGNLCFAPNTPVQFSFMPEYGGRFFDRGDCKIGFVIREKNPVRKNKNIVNTILPAFSLFSPDRHSQNDDVFLAQILKRINGYNKRIQYVKEQIYKPLIDIFFSCVIDEGIIPEMHAQNVLFAFDNDWNIKNVILRDMESHDRDITIINFIRKDPSFASSFKCIEISQANYFIKHSFMFDHKLCEYLLSEILKIASPLCSKTFEQFCLDVKDYVRQTYGEYIRDTSFFPSDGKWYKFENIEIDRELVARPYLAIDNPFFR